MRFNGSLFIILILLFSCQGKRKEKTPDISQVTLKLPVDHFERDFFAVGDSNHIAADLSRLKSKYGSFYTDFLYSIAAFSPRDNDHELIANISSFIRQYKSIVDSVDFFYPKLNNSLAQIEGACKRAKVYFPESEIPARIITYIGPFDSYGAFYSDKKLGIGLQQFLGPAYNAYRQDYLINLYGEQKLKTFSVNYIPSETMRVWLDNQFPQKTGDLRLIDIMVEEGRRVYALKRLLPQSQDAVLLGYSLDQFNWSQNTQTELMRYFTKNGLFETKKPEQILQYTSDQFIGPGLPEKFPNNIGKYIGWRLVNKYMDAHPDCSLQELFQKNLEEIALK